MGNGLFNATALKLQNNLAQPKKLLKPYNNTSLCRFNSTFLLQMICITYGY